MTSEPTVFIVDDDPAFRDSLAVLILSIGLKPEAYASGEEFLKCFDETRPGCIILDVRMPQLGGLALQEKLAAFPLCPPIIILTGHAEVPTALRAMKQGAIDFLQKTFAESELSDSVQRAIASDKEFRQGYLKRRSLEDQLNLLSRPERDVLDLVLAGHPNKRIASLLGVSQRAIEDRRARVMQKLDVNSLPELVRFALDAGIQVDK